VVREQVVKLALEHPDQSSRQVARLLVQEELRIAIENKSRFTLITLYAAVVALLLDAGDNWKENGLVFTTNIGRAACPR
jgi:hypothetical protein